MPFPYQPHSFLSPLPSKNQLAGCQVPEVKYKNSTSSDKNFIRADMVGGSGKLSGRTLLEKVLVVLCVVLLLIVLILAILYGLERQEGEWPDLVVCSLGSDMSACTFSAVLPPVRVRSHLVRALLAIQHDIKSNLGVCVMSSIISLLITLSSLFGWRNSDCLQRAMFAIVMENR